MILLTIAILAATPNAAPATEEPARMLVTLANGASTSNDYPTIAECEQARDRVVAYNAARFKIAEKRDSKRTMISEPMVQAAMCVPL